MKDSRRNTGDLKMQSSVEYQIYIGCKDVFLQDEVVTKEALTDLVVNFFTSREIDFSLVPAKGGFLHEDGRYSVEDTLCINVIGSSDDDIIKLGRSLSMIMNQESVLIAKNDLQTQFQ